MCRISPAEAPEAKTTELPLVAVKSVGSSNTPFRYTARLLGVYINVSELASDPVKVVWLASATYLKSSKGLTPANLDMYNMSPLLAPVSSTTAVPLVAV